MHQDLAELLRVEGFLGEGQGHDQGSENLLEVPDMAFDTTRRSRWPRWWWLCCAGVRPFTCPSRSQA